MKTTGCCGLLVTATGCMSKKAVSIKPKLKKTAPIACRFLLFLRQKGRNFMASLFYMGFIAQGLIGPNS
ncbi:MAG: hypothetical protein GXZ09_00980 [Syntrophomonadaceae bacterium]|nr:hypothetical protein [Syntrophomonadaceae bacterium]